MPPPTTTTPARSTTPPSNARSPRSIPNRRLGGAPTHRRVDRLEAPLVRSRWARPIAREGAEEHASQVRKQGPPMTASTPLDAVLDEVEELAGRPREIEELPGGLTN